MASQTDRGVPLSTLAPKFLHTNSTSHTWPFSAIAELIDNAYDPDVSAKQFWIDKTTVKGELCLSFTDNGNGLDHDTMHKMLSFGYSDKTTVNGVEPIGMYGNGFKSGSMRLGKDALVFSKSKGSSCVGMLSQTYLEQIEANQIIVPIVCFEETKSNKFSVREEHKASLRDILHYSPFKTKEELLAEIDTINSPWSKEKTGTRVIIWNLRRTSIGTTEFDFETDRYDIRIPSEVYETLNESLLNADRAISYTPESIYSLRAYCSILYLKPRMQVMVRGQKVQSQLIAKSLASIRKDHYKPTFLYRRVPIIFGYNTKSKDQYGIMMYHKNRLIKAYERVGCQLKANNKGVGVIGVIECNFLDPTHNKQSFNETDKYRKTMTNLAVKLEEYWNEMRFRKRKEDPTSTVPVEDTMKRPDQNWVQCDNCLKWRKLPDGIDFSKLKDEKWVCHMNPDPQFRSCQVEEEPEDSDDDQPSYRKTYKQQEREDKRRQEKPIYQPPYTPSLVRAGIKPGPSPQRSHGVSPSACSPLRTSGLPVITNVCSLSASALRGKRTPPVTPQSTPKRPRMNGLPVRGSGTAPAGDVSSLSAPTNGDNHDVSNDDGDDTDDTDDDLVILETASTPKPQKPLSGLEEVKKEEGETQISMLLECSDDAAVDATAETATAGTSPSRPATVETGHPPAVVNTTTQTEVGEVKQEKNSEDPTEMKASSAHSHAGTERRSDFGIPGPEQKGFKQEKSDDSPRATPSQRALQNGVAGMKGDEGAGPSSASAGNDYFTNHFPTFNEVQEQQDQLLELMQDTAQERDSLNEQVRKLTSQLKDTQRRLQELSHLSAKGKGLHKACQTDETETERDYYKNLFEKTKQKVSDLVKDEEALTAAAEAEAGVATAQDDEKDIDEILRRVGCLVQQLDQRNKERDELCSQVNGLKEEKSNLVAQCEELKQSLQQQREGPSSSDRNINFPTRSHPEEGAGSSGSSATQSLIELRQNVSRLLITYVPALDLEQVNYECNVIDEILEQVLNSMNSE
ncbi:MORC family CW-type zinc finger protein 3a [Cololabis saira]|uniref:MORC family CW-type zinc finger protein 3a n=1 Tax=Cololabis saira TaxID=129043 RepID=UPI002AD3177E|nr:MORC family CW-type zinc finger protein 3a [Cololabis saira]